MTNSEQHHEDQLQQNSSSQAGSANMGKGAGSSGKPQNSLQSSSASNGKQMRHSLKTGGGAAGNNSL